ncbi:MAG: hypothetical protein RJB56_50 [Actinomycetota bacterium]
MKKSLVLLLGGLQMLGPFTFDTYIAAMPAMAKDLSSSAAGIQMTILVNLIGMATGMFLAGSLSDSVGRRKPILGAVFSYFFASLIISVASDLNTVIAFRFVQGFAGAAAMTVAMAVVRDTTKGEQSAKIYSSMMVVKSIAPIIAPAIGGLILLFTDWRGIFIFLAAVALVILFWAFLSLKETHSPENRVTFTPFAVARGWGSALSDRYFRISLVANGFTTAGLFAYLSTGSFAVQQDYEMSAQVFSALLVFNGLGLLASSALNTPLLKKYKTVRAFKVGMWLAISAAVAMLSSVALPGNFVVLEIGLLLTFATVGLVTPNSMALAMQNQAKNAGTSAGLQGLVSSACGAVAILTITLVVGTSSTNLALFIAASYLLAATSLLMLRRVKSQTL